VSGSSQQRSSVFASSAPPLRVFPPASNGGSSSDSQAQFSQKGSVVAKNVKKKAAIGTGIVQGRRESAPSLKRAPARVGLVLQPPLPPKKAPAVDEMAEVGVYGAYMTSTEPAPEVTVRFPIQQEHPIIEFAAPSNNEIPAATTTTRAST
jgi:hypothetical protein